MTDNFVPSSFPFFSPHFHFEVAKGRTIRKLCVCVCGGGSEFFELQEFFRYQIL